MQSGQCVGREWPEVNVDFVRFSPRITQKQLRDQTSPIKVMMLQLHSPTAHPTHNLLTQKCSSCKLYRLVKLTQSSVFPSYIQFYRRLVLSYKLVILVILILTLLLHRIILHYVFICRNFCFVLKAQQKEHSHKSGSVLITIK